MISQRLKDFLDKERIPYEIIPHGRRFTSQEIAAEEHISGWQVAKVVMLHSRQRLIMAVLAASQEADLFKLQVVTGDPELRLAREEEFQGRFPDCEIGAMPPFGGLYGIECYADEALLDVPEIWFNGGNHEESVKIQTEDYQRISGARFADIGSLALSRR